MNMRKHLVKVIALTLSVVSLGARCSSQTWDSIRDYSTTSNPNGAWSYCRTWTTSAQSVDVMRWRWASGWWLNNPGHGGPSILDGVSLWAKNNSNGYPVVRWTCPRLGRYRFSGVFEGADSRGVDNLVYVAVNGSVLFNGHVNSPTSVVPFSGAGLILHPGDHVDFLLRWNGGVYSEYGWTRLRALISLDASCDLAIHPRSGGDSGISTVHVYGCDFLPGASLELEKVGEPSIVGTNLAVHPSGSEVAGRLDLQGRARGLWDVVVTNPGGSRFVLPGGFLIREPAEGGLQISILGSTSIRVNRRQQYVVQVANTRNVDMEGVFLWVSAGPGPLNLEVVSPLVDPPTPAPYGMTWQQFPVAIQDQVESTIPLFIPLLAGSSASSIVFSIETPSFSALTLRASASSWSALDAPCDACFTAITSTVLQLAGAVTPFGCEAQLASSIINHVCRVSSLSSGESQSLMRIVGGYAFDVLSNYVVCAGTRVPLLAELLDGLAWLRVARGAGECIGLFGANGALASLRVSPVGSQDPNDKVGPSGFPGAPPSGNSRFVSGDGDLDYMIRFENVETATAPAQEVLVLDQLDTSVFDLQTFRFGDIVLGERVVRTASAAQAFTTYVDLRPGNDLLVRVQGEVDTVGGSVTWSFLSIDPGTGYPTTDPLAGFLPPNVSPPQGEGRVLFRIRPRSGLPTGTRVENRARITFDSNVAIWTDPWTNTLDNDPPTSSVLSLDSVQAEDRFLVRWKGVDLESGIAGFSIFFSTDGGPYTPWLEGVDYFESEFQGESGKVYRFYSLAEDHCGNRELAPANPDTKTRVRFIGTVGELGPGCQGSNGMNPVQRVWWQGTAPDPQQGEPLHFALDGVPTGTAAVLWVGMFSTHWGSLRLPLDLAPFGMPGCWLHQDYFMSALPRVRPQGGLEAVVTAPVDANTLGWVSFFTTYVVVDPMGNPAGVVLSNALSVSPGERL